MDGRKAKLWTYLILGLVLVVAVVVANFAVKNPDAASEALDTFLGLPTWAYPVIAGVLGILGIPPGRAAPGPDAPEGLGVLQLVAIEDDEDLLASREREPFESVGQPRACLLATIRDLQPLQRADREDHVVAIHDLVQPSASPVRAPNSSDPTGISSIEIGYDAGSR